MKISATTTTRTKHGLKGKHLVTDGKRKYTVFFEQDKKGEYGWFQWGATPEILSHCAEETENICKTYLEIG